MRINLKPILQFIGKNMALTCVCKMKRYTQQNSFLLLSCTIVRDILYYKNLATTVISEFIG